MMTDHEGGDGPGAGYVERRRSSSPDFSDRENVSSPKMFPEEKDIAPASHIILDRLLI